MSAHSPATRSPRPAGGMHFNPKSRLDTSQVTDLRPSDGSNTRVLDFPGGSPIRIPRRVPQRTTKRRARRA